MAAHTGTDYIKGDDGRLAGSRPAAADPRRSAERAGALDDPAPSPPRRWSLDEYLDQARQLFGHEHVMTVYGPRGIDEVRINTTGSPTGWQKMASPAAIRGLLAEHDRSAA